MFRRLLIANRGEVALRIARACREVGVSPVAAVSRADLGASWLEAMDEVVCVGPAEASRSYLARESILQAALQTGCSALHPGWGFLAEDPSFAALCRQHGVVFCGPPPEVMERLGKKIAAKRAALEAGLDVLPGSDGVLAGAEEAARAAGRVGYPVILKADAGGGGRGMRLCADETELREHFAAASAEALAAFGDGSMYLERYLSGGRHIEVQILCDGFGSAVHLFERECSVQRNHQKLLEESPSPALAMDERRSLGERAARAAQGLGYVGAGTIEFLRDGDGHLYFMEMNARLQVEHPVTEMVTGRDIVVAQLAVAANRTLESLNLTQDAVELGGHAIECRINAEDPERDFLPTPGELSAFQIPTDVGPGTVRVDTHVRAGDIVSPHYDSLIAKVIAHGATREAAIETMLGTLAGTRIEGVSTTIPLHRAVLASDTFRAGDYDTRTIPGWPRSRAGSPA